MLSGIRFRPKSARSSAGELGFLPAPATFKRIKAVRANKAGILLFVVVVLWLLNPFAMLLRYYRHAPKYPPSHPFGTPHVVESVLKYIYPAIEDATKLRLLGVKELVLETRVRDPDVPEVERSVLQSLNVLDLADPLQQRAKEEDENLKSDTARVKNNFKNHEKVVFRPKSLKNYPKIVVVSAVDFDKYNMDSLAAIVQNRVNYAHEHNYGLYVRWYQEFAPSMNSFNFLTARERSKWARLFCLRAAMFAFPEAEWFWYLDEDALIMNEKVNLEEYLLDKEVLRRAILREQPVIPPNGLIKTYKNLQPENVKLIFTQLDSKIETNSFLVKNDEIGGAIIEIWHDRLFLNYNNFPFGPDSAITHILQWHPYVLSKTAIVPARTINSLHADHVSEGAKNGDHSHYFQGDLVAQWSNCAGSHCEATLQKFAPKKQ